MFEFITSRILEVVGNPDHVLRFLNVQNAAEMKIDVKSTYDLIKEIQHEQFQADCMVVSTRSNKVEQKSKYKFFTSELESLGIAQYDPKIDKNMNDLDRSVYFIYPDMEDYRWYNYHRKQEKSKTCCCCFTVRMMVVIQNLFDCVTCCRGCIKSCLKCLGSTRTGLRLIDNTLKGIDESNKANRQDTAEVYIAIKLSGKMMDEEAHKRGLYCSHKIYDTNERVHRIMYD